MALESRLYTTFRKKRVHHHLHGNQEDSHQHFHAHARSPGPGEGHHRMLGIGRPYLRKKSYLVGTVHGVAGSAALTLLVLASIDSPLAGMVYILVFGVGSVVSMGIMTILISFPFVLSANRLPRANQFIQAGVGTLSILFGAFLIYQIGFVEGLFLGPVTSPDPIPESLPIPVPRSDQAAGLLYPEPAMIPSGIVLPCVESPTRRVDSALETFVQPHREGVSQGHRVVQQQGHVSVSWCYL